jgi:hypothetical protein
MACGVSAVGFFCPGLPQVLEPKSAGKQGNIRFLSMGLRTDLLTCLLLADALSNALNSKWVISPRHQHT